ncbi:major facilitator superfamily domain-containing protein [Dactylonectria macrodidyma]|uniref:Major facilitator superfamily domain-containing protein n=1 Tax=Dactylonectria macrodidyma TaxID=307937 RepID=A0A9P9J2A9_9HYPO|nr:major facilitator superfamily domain-containing protein [Dactylonectria macrodidyma]
MFRNIFGSSSRASTVNQPRVSTSQYQAISQGDSGEEDYDGDNEMGRAPHKKHGDLASHRDAAAMLLIKLGRDPGERIAVTPADDARVLRRIDIALLPLMLAVYFLQALDKATLSYASIFGLIDDTNLEGAEYSWLGSIVYLAQLVMQPPLALALVKLPIGKLTSAMVFGWGITLVGMTWAYDFTQLMTARFFLGAFEASVGPSFIAITQMWWRRREQTMRIGSWYCMNGLTWILGSLITYGLASIDSHMKPYQVIFLFFGAITVGVSVVMYFWMPDSPTEAKFLSDNDKVIAIERLRNNQMGVMSREWRSSHVWETLRDLKTWLWVAMIFCISVPSNGISTFGPLIIQSFVSDPFQTMLFNVPVGFSHIIAVCGSAYLSMWWKLKGVVIALLCIPPIIGCSILLHFPHNEENKVVLLVGYFCLSTYTGITPLIYTWSAQNTAGDTKRKSTSALVFIGASAGNIVGPLLYSPEDAPNYSSGLRANLALYVLIVCLVVATWLHIRRLNKQHSQRRVALGKSAVVVDTSLESANEVERIETMQSALDHDRTREVGDNDTNNQQEEQEGHEHRNQQGDKAFADVTDLENEDFLFVF